jgi:argininosuccinate synthase
LEGNSELESICLDSGSAAHEDQLALNTPTLFTMASGSPRRSTGYIYPSTQRTVTGSVRLKLQRDILVAGRKSSNSLYREDLATFGEEAVYNQKDAEGFINLFGLPIKVQALARRR